MVLVNFHYHLLLQGDRIKIRWTFFVHNLYQIYVCYIYLYTGMYVKLFRDYLGVI